MFYSWFFEFPSANVKICLLGGRLGTWHQIEGLPEFSRNFLITRVLAIPQLLSRYLNLQSLGNACIHFLLIIM